MKTAIEANQANHNRQTVTELISGSVITRLDISYKDRNCIPTDQLAFRTGMKNLLAV